MNKKPPPRPDLAALDSADRSGGLPVTARRSFGTGTAPPIEATPAPSPAKTPARTPAKPRPTPPPEPEPDTAANVAGILSDPLCMGARRRLNAHMAKACDEFGGLDILVANAGGRVGLGLTEELTEEQWDAGLAANCKSVFLCVKHAIRRFPDVGGRIIVTSSISARSGAMPGALTYAAAKAALNNMVRCWAKELAPRKTTVNAIAPGVIWTRLYERAALPPEEFEKLLRQIPLGRAGKPQDCVGAVLLLASDDGSYITGQIIEINGGKLMP